MAILKRLFRIATGAVGGDDDGDDKEKEEEAERERQEAIKEAEDRRKEKHRKMEEEREKMRQEIRDKVFIQHIKLYTYLLGEDAGVAKITQPSCFSLLLQLTM